MSSSYQSRAKLNWRICFREQGGDLQILRRIPSFNIRNLAAIHYILDTGPFKDSTGAGVCVCVSP